MTSAKKRPPARVLAVLGLLVLPAAYGDRTFTIKPLLLEGDDVPGVGVVTTIDNLAVNNRAAWLVECDTDNSDGDRDAVIVRSDAVYVREGDAVDPPGASIDTFDSVNLSNTGNQGWNFFLSGTGGLSTDSGIYFKTSLVIQESTFSISPQFSPNTPYIGWFDAKINDADQILLVASIDDAAIPTTVDRAIVILNLDAAGQLVSEDVLAKEGDVLDGMTEAVSDFGTGPHQSAINSHGVAVYLADLAGSASTDGTLWKNKTLVAQEGSPSPIAGRNFEILLGNGIDINDAGNVVFKANLDGDTADDGVIFKDAAVVAREGSTIPAIAPFLIENFGTSSGPVQIDSHGNVLWFGDWNDPNTDADTGLFLNGQLLVQEGVTQIEGRTVDILASGDDAFQMSDSGQYIIFEATMTDGTNGAYLISFCEPCDANCDGTVNQFDIQPFVEQLFPGAPTPCSPCAADTDANGSVNQFDIQGFVDCLTG